MLAGSLRDPVVEQLIKYGDTDFVCLGRQSIADPEFPNKLERGEVDDIVV